MENIPVFMPLVGQDTIDHFEDAIKVGWLGLGKTTKKFEELISEYLNLDERYVVATNTGTSALHLALRVGGIGPGDEVITPSFNYVADHQAILMSGAKVVMCDIRDDNLGIDCEKAKQLISDKTKAIIPLHFAGIPCELKAVYDLAEKNGLRVIEDATHAFGTTINEKKIGSFGDMACFSFDPVKIITSIDGGCVVVNRKEEFQNLQKLRLLGVDKDAEERYKNKRAWDYDVVSEGYRYHLTNIMASVGISQIKRIAEFIQSRRKVCTEYNQEFSKIDGLRTPQTDFANVSPFIYTLRVLNNKRDDLINHLKTLNIDVGIHLVPVHKHTYFKNSRCGDMAVTDKVVKEVVTLPLHSNMQNDFVRRVIEGVKTYFE